MFDRICIKGKEISSQKFDVSALIETMLFYGKVVLLVHRTDLVVLFKALGVGFLEELIKSGRIEINVAENILGSMVFPVGNTEKYNVDLLSRQNESYDAIIYQAHREFVRNSSQNIQFASSFSKIVTPFRYGEEVTSQIRSDFENKEYLIKALPLYINSIVPQFEVPEKIEVEIVKDSSFGQFEAYSVNSNLDLQRLNELHEKNNPSMFHRIGYGGFILSIAESKGDLYIATHLESELVTSDLYSRFISIQLADLLQKRSKSIEELKLFDEYVLSNCGNIGEAYINGRITNKELLELLVKADKFRSWLQNVPSDKSLIGEYYRVVSEKTFAEKLPTKFTRFIIFTGIGITLDLFGAGGIGTGVSTGLSAFDSFYLDKILKGWKPNQFIDDQLKPMIKK